MKPKSKTRQWGGLSAVIVMIFVILRINGITIGPEDQLLIIDGIVIGVGMLGTLFGESPVQDKIDEKKNRPDGWNGL